VKLPVNLASQPFRRDRPAIVAAVVLSLVLVGLLAVLIALARSDRHQLADARAEVARLQADLNKLSADLAREEAVLRQPENAEVLERGLFLNALLYRKGISWTRIFADLEKTLPYNVRVISIRPTVNAQNQVTLDMVVGSESPEPFIGLLKSLQDSPLFGSVDMHGSTPPSQTNPLYQYRVSVNYAQKL
jgi:type IV pilus assembly protein PilN